jgi:hypothetical protein
MTHKIMVAAKLVPNLTYAASTKVNTSISLKFDNQARIFEISKPNKRLRSNLELKNTFVDADNTFNVINIVLY